MADGCRMLYDALLVCEPACAALLAMLGAGDRGALSRSCRAPAHAVPAVACATSTGVLAERVRDAASL